MTVSKTLDWTVDSVPKEVPKTLMLRPGQSQRLVFNVPPEEFI